MCSPSTGIFAYHSAASAPADTELLATRDAMRARGPDGANTWWSADRRCGLGHRGCRSSTSPTALPSQWRAPTATSSSPSTARSIIIGCCVRSSKLPAPASARTPTPKRFCTSTRATAARWCTGCAACSLSRSGTPRGANFFLPATPTASNRSTSQTMAGRPASPHRSRRCWPAAAFGDPEPAGVAGFICSETCPNRSRSIATFAPCRPGTRSGSMQRVPRAQPFANLAGSLRKARPPLPLPPSWGNSCARPCATASAPMLADVEVGIFLSAGVDLGALLAYGRRRPARDPRDHPRFRRVPRHAGGRSVLAGQVAQRYGVANSYGMSARANSARIPRTYRGDGPALDRWRQYVVRGKGRKAGGLKFALSGLGGDELLAGYSSFADLPRWRRRFGPLAALPGLGQAARPLIRAFAPRVARDRPKALGLLQYAGSWAGVYCCAAGSFCLMS